jgi:hypothetical protein
VLKSKEPAQKPLPDDPQDVSLRNTWNCLQADSAGAVILRAGAVSIFSASEYFLLQPLFEVKIVIAGFLQVIKMIQNRFTQMI